MEKDIDCPACKVPTNKGLPHGAYCPIGGYLTSAPTLRDQLAMAVITGLLANTKWTGQGADIKEMDCDAEAAYRWADSMLKARKPKEAK